MSTRETISKSVQYVLQLFLLPLSILILVSSCGDDPTTPADQIENAKGTVQGVVIDKATGDALSDVGVTLVYEDSTDEGSQTFSGSTGDDGSFTLSDVPVSTDAKTNDGDKSNPYTLRLDASSLDNYRDSYLAEVDVVFESTEGGDGGVATDMVSNIRIPLSEQTVTVSGKAHTTSGKVISGATVELYQIFNPVVNGDNSTQTNMLVASGETGDDGSFSFEGVEEDATVYFKFVDKSDPANVIDHRTINYNTPTGSENNASMDLGVVKTQPDDQSGAFYITDISPEPGSDVSTDTEFTFTFNRPVADNAWTDASQGFGAGTFKDAIYFEDDGPKKSPGDIEFDVSWNDDRTELTITPENLVDANEYRLRSRAALDNSIDGNNVGGPLSNGPIAYEDGNFVDEYGNDLTYNASDYEWHEAERLEFSTGDNQDAPHTPEVAVDSTSLSTDWNGGSHNLAWNVDNDPAEVKEYEIFISKDGGAYEHLATVPADDAEFGELDYNLYGTSNPTNEVAYNSYARRLIVDDSYPRDEAHSYDVKVRAISINLQEGDFSDPIAFEDVTDPVSTSAAVGSTNDDEMYVQFSEPMVKDLVEDSDHYTFEDANGQEIDAEIESVEYDYRGQNNPDDGTNYDVIITFVDSNDAQDVASFDMSEDVTDLSGNSIDI